MVGMGRDPPTYIQYSCSLVMDKAPSVPNMAMPQMQSPSQAKSVPSNKPYTARNGEEEHPAWPWAEGLSGHSHCFSLTREIFKETLRSTRSLGMRMLLIK